MNDDIIIDHDFDLLDECNLSLISLEFIAAQENYQEKQHYDISLPYVVNLPDLEIVTQLKRDIFPQPSTAMTTIAGSYNELNAAPRKKGRYY